MPKFILTLFFIVEKFLRTNGHTTLLQWNTSTMKHYQCHSYWGVNITQGDTMCQPRASWIGTCWHSYLQVVTSNFTIVNHVWQEAAGSRDVLDVHPHPSLHFKCVIKGRCLLTGHFYAIKAFFNWRSSTLIIFQRHLQMYVKEIAITYHLNICEIYYELLNI